MSAALPPNRQNVGRKSAILTVAQLLGNQRLQIPHYQRPYKWTERNVQQLFDDIKTFSSLGRYRLGTVVFHDNVPPDAVAGPDGVNDGATKPLDIVDGQQRTITLLLTLHALQARIASSPLARDALQEQIHSLASQAFRPEFRNSVSKDNLRANYRTIQRIVKQPDFDERTIDFLLNSCEVVTFALTDLTEAFQFFDSQNARGKDLDPHDLLKAFHLREFDRSDAHLKATTVRDWETAESSEIADLFSNVLYRVRNWSRGAPARQFQKKDIDLFKGVNLTREGSRPFVQQLRIAHHFVDHFNGQYERSIVGGQIPFPFQLDQTIVNGRRFFEKIAHYRKMAANIVQESRRFDQCSPSTGLSQLATNILVTLNSYPGRHRSGDRYVRDAFECLLVYYFDRFGPEDFSRAIEVSFVWAYSLRIRLQMVQWASVDNHVTSSLMFQRLRDAREPRDFLSVPLSPCGPLRSKGTDELYAIFIEMGYHE